MSYFIKEMSVDERPRERLKKYGVQSLSNEELLSILMRTGTKDKSVKELSFLLLSRIKLHDFTNVSFHTLKSIKGIGDAKALSILAAVEFGKRVLSKRELGVQIRTGDDVFNVIKEDLNYEIQEKFLALFLDTRKKIIDKKVIFVGTVNGSNITPRDVFREGVKCNATSMIIAHNHPAGSINPSREDIELTKDFVFLGKMMGITITDHIIISNNDYLSLRMLNPDLFY